MTPITLDYLRAIEHELIVMAERFEAASDERHSQFSYFNQKHATADREKAADAFKHQQQYFQLMGVDWKEFA